MSDKGVDLKLSNREALVLIEFLLRFRDGENLSIAHPAEEQLLWDLAAMLESEIPELLDPKYKVLLDHARAEVESSENY